jgi:hypothetical protein
MTGLLEQPTAIDEATSKLLLFVDPTSGPLDLRKDHR